MSGFKDQVEADIHDVFLDLDFFGETWQIEGKPVAVVVDSDELKARQGGQDFAVAESATLFYARSADLPRRRAAGESININGRECLIDDWQDDMGLATLVLRENVVV